MTGRKKRFFDDAFVVEPPAGEDMERNDMFEEHPETPVDSIVETIYEQADMSTGEVVWEADASPVSAPGHEELNVPQPTVTPVQSPHTRRKKFNSFADVKRSQRTRPPIQRLGIN